MEKYGNVSIKFWFSDWFSSILPYNVFYSHSQDRIRCFLKGQFLVGFAQHLFRVSNKTIRLLYRVYYERASAQLRLAETRARSIISE